MLLVRFWSSSDFWICWNKQAFGDWSLKIIKNPNRCVWPLSLFTHTHTHTHISMSLPVFITLELPNIIYTQLWCNLYFLKFETKKTIFPFKLFLVWYLVTTTRKVNTRNYLWWKVGPISMVNKQCYFRPVELNLG